MICASLDTGLLASSTQKDESEDYCDDPRVRDEWTWWVTRGNKCNSCFLFSGRRGSRLASIGGAFLGVVILAFILTFLFEDNYRHEKLLERESIVSGNGPLVNCSPLAVDQFPADLFTQSQRRSGALVLHVILVLYMFLALAIVCDEFFVPALEAISKGLNLKEDVAGATFMAIGSSTPELFTSVIGVFITKDDIGVGTIVGSAVFNIIFIIALCGLLTEKAFQLSWYPLIRDCSFYTISIFALVCIIYDHTVYWYEALLMLSLYAFYIFLMYINDGLSEAADEIARALCPLFCCPGQPGYEDVPLTEGDAKELSTDEMAEKKAILNGVADPKLSDEETSDDISGSGKSIAEQKAISEVELDLKDADEILEEDSTNDSLFSRPDGACGTVLWVCALPLYVLLSFTVPDCKKHSGMHAVFAAFVISTLWIAVFSYLLVWMVTVIGYTVSIPDTIMGLTLLAAGTSVPDAMSSVIVARNGEGDMAVSNSIGSNIFDILLCLGLPWMMKSVEEPVIINSAGLTYIALTLTTTVVVIVSLIMCNKWLIDRRLGVFLLFLYIVFVVYASLVETNTFGYVNPPPCR